MGKPDKQPRVKGNAKPASSSRAAELASNNASPLSFQNLGGFAQFVNPTTAGIATVHTSRPATPSSDSSDMTVELEPELVVILKKISKRDATTKLKALEELDVYLKAHADTIPYILPSWVAMYVKLVFEVDRRVRFATNTVHYRIVSGTKKKLAPYLKEIIGAWMIAMFDPSKDVATKAKSAFETVFAEEKRQGVVIFCQEEIVRYMTEMLLYKTPETLSDARHVSKDDMAAKYARVISSSLSCVSYLIEEIPAVEQQKLTESYNTLLDAPRLWKLTSHENPIIRKAMYAFTKSLLLHGKGLLEARLEIICPSFFGSVFVEKDATTHTEMWDALLLITKVFPQSWNKAVKKKSVTSKLCTLLRAGLNGAANVAYPAVLPLLAHLPAEMTSSPTFCKDIFTSFWKGLSSDAIDMSNSPAFINAYGECIVYFATLQSKQDDQEISKASIVFLIEHAVWDAVKTCFVSGRDAPYHDKLVADAHQTLAKHVVSLSATEGVQGYMASFWNRLDELLVQTVTDCTPPANCTIDHQTFFKKAGEFLLATQSIPESRSITHRLLLASLTSSIVHKQFSSGLLWLANTLFHESLVNGSELAVKEVVENAPQLLELLDQGPESSVEPLMSLYTTIVLQNTDSNAVKGLWDDLLGPLLKMREKARQTKAVVYLLEKLKGYSSKTSVYPNMDDLLKTYAMDMLHTSVLPAEIRCDIERIVALALSLYSSHSILTESTAKDIMSGFEANIRKLKHSQATLSSQPPLDEVLLDTSQAAQSSLQILKTVFMNNPDKISVMVTPSMTREVFDAMLLKQGESSETTSTAPDLAADVWGILSNKGHITQYADYLFEHVKASIDDTQSLAHPLESVDSANELLNTLCANDRQRHAKAVNDLMGTEVAWKELARPYGEHTSDFTALAVVDPYAGLVQASFLDSDELMPISYDGYGFGDYGRHILFATEFILKAGVQEFFFCDNAGPERDWIILQLLRARYECEYGLQVPGLCRIWDSKVEASTRSIKTFVGHVDKLLDEWLAIVLAHGKEWPSNLLDDVKTTTETGAQKDRLVSLLLALIHSTNDSKLCGNSTVQDATAAKIFQGLFTRMLSALEWRSSDLQQWVPLARIEATELHLLIKVALVESLKGVIGETQAFRNLQSDLASNLSAITSLQAFADGDPRAWSRLVLLNSSALAIGIAIPQQRLLRMILALRNCFGDDNEDHLSVTERSLVLVQLARLFSIVSESIQDAPGSHWELFLDKSLEWIKHFDADVIEELPLVYHGLRLYDTVRILARGGNDSMADEVRTYTPQFHEALLDLFAKECAKNQRDMMLLQPRQQYQALLSDLLDDIPDATLLASNHLSNLCALLDSPNESVQRRAFALAQKLVAHTVEEMSVRLEFTETTEKETDASIDKAILDRLLSPPDLSLWDPDTFGEGPVYDTMGFLASWLLMLGHFENITFKLKQEYTTQLKDLDSMSKLLPTLFHLLRVGTGQGTHAFDVSPWSVDVYHMDGFDASSEHSFLLLSAHIYYKALRYIPSLVRTWWMDCKNRRLAVAVEAYTEKYYSSQLIKNELELLDRPDIKAQLQNNEGNEFSVKRMRASNELLASYSVDEQVMQISIRLPKTFPLRQIDVEGVQKVGVNDNQWRGWIFAVSAVIGFQNGSIFDALTVFKRNANLHFEGAEDCTICYSIISVLDRSIPTKRCRTCKNKFHASCLYKWFRSSNSASCPLCRTVF